jgi:glycosyltransferase involved in cell wall biosynthesis
MPESVEWEVLVVDNNSNDGTREVAETFSKMYPGRFRYLFELKQGKSNALNAGVQEASGEILAFTDDDVIVAPTWLWNITAALDSGKWSSAGGRIGAANSFQCPRWLPLEGEYNLGGVLGFFDLGDKAGNSTEPFFGGNVAYRKEMFEKYGLYRTDLGRCGESMLSDEDMEFSRRIIAGGERLWYEPSAVVYHAVPKERLRKSFFLRFLYDQGRSQIRATGSKPGVFGIPRWCFSIPAIVLKSLIPRLMGWLFTLDPKRSFYFKCMVWKTFGQIAELPRIGLKENRGQRSIIQARESSKGNPLPRISP